MKTDKKEKIKLSRMIKNILYVISFAKGRDKMSIVLYIIAFSGFVVANAIFDTVMLKRVIDQISDRAPVTDVVMTAVIAFGIILTAVLLINISESLIEARMIKITGKIQRNFLDKCSRMDLIYYDNPTYYDDFVLAASQSEQMIGTAIHCLAYFVGNILGVIVAGGVIFTINPLIAIFPVAGFILNIITRFAITKQEYLYDLEKKKINRKSDYSKRVFYQPEYAKEIKLSGIEVPLRAQFEKSIEEERAVAKKYGIKIALLSLVNWIGVFTLLSSFCVPVTLAYLAVVKKQIRLGDVASTQNATNTVRGLLDSTNYALVELQKVGLFAERFRRFVEYKENIEVWEGTKSSPEKGDLELKNVYYKYDGAKDYTLKNINMTIKSGEHIAIVGENGAGKTTLIKLLMRLYDVSEGEIMFGENNIKDYSIKDYRGRISAVFQDYQMYAASLGENVFMQETSEADNDVIHTALGKADFTARLNKMKNGIETQLTREFDDNGTQLSGGEAQKVAISRMFARGKAGAISILDEPSSALDPIAEYTLNTNMTANAADSTIIFISHRLSTTRDADRIYMFAHGEIIEQGTHDELMALGGEYTEMFEKQAENYKINA